MSTQDDIAHIEATIAGLEARKLTLVRAAENIPNPPDCPHCKSRLETVFYCKDFKGFESWEGEWSPSEAGSLGWWIDYDKPSNTDETDHVCTVHCGECEGILPYSTSVSDSWVPAVEVEIEKTPEDEDVSGLFATCDEILEYLDASESVSPAMTAYAERLRDHLERLNS